MIRSTDGGVEFDVRVIPRAQKTAAAGLRGDAIVIRLAAPPIDGVANDALVRFLSETLDVPQRAVRITSGLRARRKRVDVRGVTEAQVRAALLR